MLTHSRNPDRYSHFTLRKTSAARAHTGCRREPIAPLESKLPMWLWVATDLYSKSTDCFVLTHSRNPDRYSHFTLRKTGAARAHTGCRREPIAPLESKLPMWLWVATDLYRKIISGNVFTFLKNYIIIRGIRNGEGRKDEYRGEDT